MAGEWQVRYRDTTATSFDVHCDTSSTSGQFQFVSMTNGYYKRDEELIRRAHWIAKKNGPNNRFYNLEW